MTDLVLRRILPSRPAAQDEDDYDVIADGTVVSRIFKAISSPAGRSWAWTLAYGYQEDRTPTHGYEATRETAMQAFARSWHRES